MSKKKKTKLNNGKSKRNFHPTKKFESIPEWERFYQKKKARS
jgi:hypothetical protein